METAATVQSPVDEDTGELLLRRPRQKVSGTVGYRWASGAEFALLGHVASRRRDFGGDLGGYALFDLTATMPLDEAWGLELRLDNALDRDYSLVQGYRTPGRAWFLGVHWRNP